MRRQPPDARKPIPTVGGEQPADRPGPIFLRNRVAEKEPRRFILVGQRPRDPRPLGWRPHAGQGRAEVTADRPLRSVSPQSRPRRGRPLPGASGISSAALTALRGDRGHCKVGGSTSSPTTPPGVQECCGRGPGLRWPPGWWADTPGSRCTSLHPPLSAEASGLPGPGVEGADPGNPTPGGHSSRRSPRTVRLNSRGHACFPPCAWSLGSQHPPLADRLQAQLCALVARQGPPAGRSEEAEGWRRPAQLSGSRQGHRHSAATPASEGSAGPGGGSHPRTRGAAASPDAGAVGAGLSSVHSSCR